MSKKQEMIDEVYSEQVMKVLLADMSEEDKAKVDSALHAFVEEVSLPLVDVFEQLINDPDAMEELKRQLGKSQNVVVKK